MTRTELYKGIEIIKGAAVFKVAEDDLLAFVEGAVSDFQREISKVLPEITEQAGICFGLKKVPEMEGARLIVARGLAPENGKDGRIEITAESFKESQKSEVHDSGTVDLRNLNRIANVARGEVIAKKILPTPGKPGMNIFGEEANQKPGELKTFKLGEGVEILDSNTLIASRDGAISIDADGLISVESEWVVDGDVDTATGHVEFWGEKLTITGSVSGGFTVEAAGDLVIEGQVNDDAIILAGGLIHICGIIRSRNTMVKAGSGLSCSAVEYARIFSGGDVRISDYLLDARLQAEGCIEVSGGKGLIAGGNIELGGSLTAETIGSPANVRTVIAAGINPLLMRHYEGLVLEQEKNAKKLSDIRSGLEKMKKIEAARGSLDPRMQKVKTTLQEAAAAIASNIEAAKTRIMELEQHMGSMENASITVIKKAHANCKIEIYKASLILDRPLEGVSFSFQKGDIMIQHLTKDNDESEQEE